MILNDIFVIGGVFCSFITSFLLFHNKEYHRYANRFLSIVLFSWGWYALLYTFLVSGWITLMPHIWRIGSPLYYLIPPCGYLYVRSLINGETQLKKYDWLHFLPAGLHFVELIPFYLSSADEKQLIVNAVSKNFNLSFHLGSGLVPALWHFAVRPFIGITYAAFIWPLVLKFYRSKDNVKPKYILSWLVIFGVSLTVIYLNLAIQTIIALNNLGSQTSLVALSKTPQFLMSMAFLGVTCYLFFKPDILYGTRFYFHSRNELPGGIMLQFENNSSANNVIPVKAPNQNIDLEQYVDVLEKTILEKQLFRRHKITVYELSAEVKIQSRNLSILLNNYYHKRFTDFINSYRVEYVKQRLSEENWKDFTLEGLAKEAGFSSRSTFFDAFKKSTGLSPTEYLRTLDSAENKDN